MFFLKIAVNLIIMISIKQSNFRNLKTYYQFTRQQLENLQNQVKFVMKDQSAQINIMALFDVLTNCEQTTYISIELLKLQLKIKTTSVHESKAIDNKILVWLLKTKNQAKLYNKSKNTIGKTQEIKEKMEKIQLSQSDSTSVKEMIGKLALSKVQLKFYENELQMRQDKIKKLQLEISNIKNQLALKDLQLQLADLVLNELPFCSPFKQEYLQKVKNEFFELEYYSRISKRNAHKKDKKLSLIFSQRVKDSKISLGVQIQDSSKMKRIHEWLRTKVISQRIKM